MLAILLSEKMDPFYQNVALFPTAFFSFFLALCMLYWCVAALGLIDIGALDLDGLDVGGDIDINVDTNITSGNALAGLMMRLGLNGVPVTIIVSLISLIGWVLCFNVVYFLFGWVPDGIIRFIVGLPVIAGCLYAAAMLTAIIMFLK